MYVICHFACATDTPSGGFDPIHVVKDGELARDYCYDFLYSKWAADFAAEGENVKEHIVESEVAGWNLMRIEHAEEFFAWREILVRGSRSGL